MKPRVMEAMKRARYSIIVQHFCASPSLIATNDSPAAADSSCGLLVSIQPMS
jgi:hypothetical protein